MFSTTVLRPARSRRGLLQHFLGSAAAMTFAPVNTLAQQINVAASLQTPPADPDSDAASLAARNDIASRLTIEVLVNGKGPYRFIVDTGAEQSVIADNVATALGLTYGQPIMVDGIARRVTVPTVTVDSLAYGPFVRNNLHMPVLPRTTLLIDGYLGLDTINGSRVTFDFRNHAVRIEQPRELLVPPLDKDHEERIRARGSAGRLRVVDCLVDSIAATAFIDTGAEVSVGNLPLRDALKSRNKLLPYLAEMTLTGVTGGEVTGDVIPVSRISLQNLNFTNGALVVADVPDFDNWRLNNRPALLIGMDYLRQLASVTIDYRFKEIRFTLSLAPPPKPTPGVEIVNQA